MNKAIRILIVDDDPKDIEVFSELLQAQAYEVWAAATGLEGLKLARERCPNLVLLDVELPDLSGIEVCRQIKADAALSDVFVVLFSGDATSPESVVGGLETGADDYIVKGVDTRAFLARIRTTIRLQETTKALRASEEQFRQLAENVREVFWMTNPEKDKMLYVSPAYEVIWGRSCESLYASPMSWIEAIHPADRERVREAAPTKQAIGDYEEEYRIVRPDGSLLWIKDRAFPIRDESGKVYRIAGLAEDITKRRQMEEALRESQARQSAIMEKALDGIITFDHEGRIIELNSTATKIIGCARDSAIGKDLCEVIIPSGLRDWFRQGLAHCFAVEEGPTLDSRIEMSALRSDGSEFPIECAITRIEPVGPPMFTAFVRDISDRRRAETQVSMLAHAVESTDEPICITDLQDRFTFTNRAFQKAYGYTKSEILGKTPELLISPNNPPTLLAEILEQSRSTGWRGEVLDRRKDGTEFPVFLSTSHITNEAGRVMGLLGVAQDITARKQAEAQIQLLANAVQSAKLLISITDDKNRFSFVNHAFIKAYGYTEAEIIGKTPHFLYSQKNPPGVCDKVFRDTLAGSWEGQIYSRRKDGTELPVALNTSQIKDSQGKLLGLVRVARDISDIKQAERQQATLSQLAYRLSAAVVAKEAANVIWDIASNLFEWDAGYVSLYSAAEDKFINVLGIDTVNGQPNSIPPSDRSKAPTPLMRLIMKEGGQLINRSKGAFPPVKLVRFGNLRRRSESMLCVPIRWRGTVLGILSIQSYKRGAYTMGDLGLLQTIADHCGNTLHRIQTTEALRAAEAKYHSIVENAAEGIFQTTPEGRYLSANRAEVQMLGYQTPEELISSINDIGSQTYVSPERLAELKLLLNAQPTVRGFEAERYRKDGTKIWVSINVRAVRDANGALLYFEGNTQEITKRKETEAALHQTQRLQRAILDNIPDPAWLKDATGRYLACNESLAKLRGKTREQIIGKTVSDLAYPDAAKLVQDDNETMGSHESILIEGMVSDPAGHNRWFEIIKSPWFDEAGEVAGTVGIAREITQRKQIEKELRNLPRRILEAQETERLRVAGELHDGVNQIIASAKIRLRTAADSLGNFKPAAREILLRCERLLVKAIEENRRISHNLRPSDLDDLGLMSSCRNFCREFRARTGLAVKCNLARSNERLPPEVELNFFRIVQEAFNNIEKHASARNVQLRIAVQQHSVLLKITDDGKGIGPNHGKAVKKKRQGMGLTNMRERAFLLGGTCEVLSAPNQGTEISVRVPLTGK